MIRAAPKVNDRKPQWVFEKDHQAVGQFPSINPDKNAKILTVACFGLAFKLNVDDLLENPALKIANGISEKYASEAWAVEPYVKELSKLASSKLALVHREQGLSANIVVPLVDHRLLREYKWAKRAGKLVVCT